MFVFVSFLKVLEYLDLVFMKATQETHGGRTFPTYGIYFNKLMKVLNCIVTYSKGNFYVPM